MSDTESTSNGGVKQRKAAEKRLSWLLGIGIVVALAGFSLLSALGQQLELMHLGSQESASVQSPEKAYLSDAVRIWRNFDERVRATVGEGVFVSPKALIQTFFLVDTRVFLPGYLLGGLALLSRGLKNRHTSPSLRKLILTTIVLLLATALFDLFENGITLELVNRYWDAFPRTPEPSWMDSALSVMTILKLLCGGLVLLLLVPLALNAISHRRRGSKATRRLLRPFVVVAIVALILLNLPIQLSDLFLGLDAQRAWKVVSSTLLLGVSLWTSARAVIALHEKRFAKDRSISTYALVGLLSLPVAVLAWNLIARGNWRVAAIPIGMVAVLMVLGLALRGAQIPETGDVERKLPELAITGPQILASTMVALVGFSALRALVLQWVQKGDVSVLRALGVGLLLASVIISLVIYKVETWVVRLTRDGNEKVAGIRGLVAKNVPDEVLDWRPIIYGSVAVFCASVITIRGVALIKNPQNASSIGAIAVVLTFLAFLALITGAFALFAGWWSDRFRLPFVFRAFRLKSVPIFTLLLVWGAIAASIDDGSHWNVRVLPRPGQAVTRSEPYMGMKLEAAFVKWIKNQPRLGPAKDGKSVPLFILAASGGGIRAAYWTALSMDCLLLGKSAQASTSEKAPCVQGEQATVVDGTSSLFLASGISGSSLGLVEWDANQGEEWDTSWVEERLGKDFVAPSMAQGLFVEFARSFLQFPSAGRAEVLEDAWVQAWGEDDADNPMNQGFFASQKMRRESGGPFLILNGSSVFDGCALNVSFLDMGSTIDQSLRSAHAALSGGDCTSVQRYTGFDFEERDGNPPKAEDLAPGGDEGGPLPATADLLDYLDCPTGTDVTRATAALLSARFPYVSSAGRLAACGGDDSAKFIVDGGYVDTSGAESALAVWSALDPMVQGFNSTHANTCITPYFIQLDNGYLPTLNPRADRKPPNQLLAPLQALQKTTGLGSRADRARAMAAELFTRPFPPDRWEDSRDLKGRYALIAPRAHPGVEAPLGWTLSEQSRRDLETQLYVGNRNAIKKVRSWLETPKKCP